MLHLAAIRSLNSVQACTPAGTRVALDCYEVVHDPITRRCMYGKLLSCAAVAPLGTFFSLS